MIQIRKGTFETNSSSTHSICISKQSIKSLPSKIRFRLHRFGWENAYVFDTAAYLYSGIQDLNEDIRNEYMDRLENILKKYGIDPVYENPSENTDYQYFGVDHAYELIPIIDQLFKDEDLLLRFLISSKSCVYTGNDNQDFDANPNCYRASPTISKYSDIAKQWEEIPNPDYHPDKFDYFLKGN